MNTRSRPRRSPTPWTSSRARRWAPSPGHRGARGEEDRDRDKMHGRAFHGSRGCRQSCGPYTIHIRRALRYPDRHPPDRSRAPRRFTAATSVAFASCFEDIAVSTICPGVMIRVAGCGIEVHTTADPRATAPAALFAARRDNQRRNDRGRPGRYGVALASRKTLGRQNDRGRPRGCVDARDGAVRAVWLALSGDYRSRSRSRLTSRQMSAPT